MSLDHDDYATFARIEDHLRRIADALERPRADDRTCTDRDHWAPTGRINHGSTPTTCVHGQDHPDDLEREYACPATMPGHRCTRLEHAEGGHLWAMSDEEAERILRAGQELGFVAEADPLDESDHWPRHEAGGAHVYRWGFEHWHFFAPEGAQDECGCGGYSLADRAGHLGPLTFCNCATATIEAENGATD